MIYPKKETNPLTDTIKIKKFNDWLKRGQDYPIKRLQKSGNQDTVFCTLYADYQ